jgi:hypothetical protein
MKEQKEQKEQHSILNQVLTPEFLKQFKDSGEFIPQQVRIWLGTRSKISKTRGAKNILMQLNPGKPTGLNYHISLIFRWRLGL